MEAIRTQVKEFLIFKAWEVRGAGIQGFSLIIL